ncbi:hypothetical protein ACR4U3_004661 [Salmonella enterica]
MDYNQPDSDNQPQQLKVWRMQPEKCKRISYFFYIHPFADMIQRPAEQPERWGKEIRNWNPINEVYLNPEKEAA